jgi:1-acyl-sn-glycerol-3-phosphate acyltransferase
MYLFVKGLTNFLLWVYCKRFALYNPKVTKITTPMILGCNHPNSFLDAIIIGAKMKQRVHFMTRSDVFQKAWVRAILRSVNMIPVYRIRDGKENLGKNDASFEETRRILMRGEQVLIFVEGFCKYQTTLQLPLKKGGPRMLTQAWEDGVDAKMLPVWIRYSSFTQFPKEIDINFGTPFGKEILQGNEETGATLLAINKETEKQLQQLSTIDNRKPAVLSKAILFLPAVIGMLLHIPLYVPLQKLAWKVKGEIHYDSILFCMLAFLYPLYIILVALLVCWLLGGWWALVTIVAMPLLAKTYTLWK